MDNSVFPDVSEYDLVTIYTVDPSQLDLQKTGKFSKYIINLGVALKVNEM